MRPNWYIDETAHAGAEHLDPGRVASYDEKIPFDADEEVAVLREQGLAEDDTVVDFGTGTGEFPLAAAPHCGRVVGVDASEAMLDVARGKLDDAGVTNVDLVHGGMVEYDHEGAPAAAVFSKNALHHLPDFWKVEALRTMHETLEPGGLLRLRDIVYSFDPVNSHEEVEAWLEGMEGTLFTEAELHRHFREEFSTYDFCMEPMLREAGYEICEADYRAGFYAAYTCRATE